MAEHNHIVLQDCAEERVFVGTGGGQKSIPVRDEQNYARVLLEQYNAAVSYVRERRAEVLPQGVETADGIYLDFQMDESANSIPSLDGKNGARIMNIRETGQEGLKNVTVFIPKKRDAWFPKKMDEYATKRTTKNHPKNQPFVNAIEQIRVADLRSFFTEPNEFQLPDIIREYEVWVRKDDFNWNVMRQRLEQLGIQYGSRQLVFEELVVVLVIANHAKLQQIVECVSSVLEIHAYKKPSVLSRASNINEEKEYIQLLAVDIPMAEAPLTRIGILDSGVNYQHPLLQNVLPRERCFSATLDGSLKDEANHGTAMAGLVVLGDVTERIYAHEQEPIVSDLLSVKILHDDDEGQYEKEMYAVVTEDAILTAKDNDVHTLCSAITLREEAQTEHPSILSAAIDQSLYANGASDSLLLLSAGNVDTCNHGTYPDYLLTSRVYDPAQSWNALTVGAYTEKTTIADPFYTDKSVVAPKDGISPFSRNSYLWGEKTLIKPEIMMEGGNAIMSVGDISPVPDLSLVSLHSDIKNHLFYDFNATSAATAMAANLAGKIMHYNPSLSPLSVRALLVHSAEWTDRMRELCSNNINKLLHTCGYGVPNAQKAMLSEDSYVTFIAEDEIKPLKLSEGGAISYSHMNTYRLPWPVETLRQMDTAKVKLRITLSYYIEPCPGTRGKLSKYLYQSMRLAFDVRQAEEDEAGFYRRVSHSGDADALRNNTGRWEIGIQNRNQGCVISDYIELSARQMASCDLVAVYPSSGWYKSRKGKVDSRIKYSLVVSLETPKQDIYAEIAQKVGIASSVAIEASPQC